MIPLKVWSILACALPVWQACRQACSTVIARLQCSEVTNTYSADVIALPVRLAAQCHVSCAIAEPSALQDPVHMPSAQASCTHVLRWQQDCTCWDAEGYACTLASK